VTKVEAVRRVGEFPTEARRHREIQAELKNKFSVSSCLLCLKCIFILTVEHEAAEKIENTD
jgi:hypothetical protein